MSRVKLYTELSLAGVLLGFLLFPQMSWGAEIRWNGFASMYARHTKSKSIRDKSADPNGIATSNDSKFGLNIRADIDNEWAAVGQFVVSQKNYTPENEAPNWGGEFDWFFLSYRNLDYQFEVKAGRQLFPSTLTAEYVDVGITYPWRRVPQQFSTISQFKAFEGVSISRRSQLGDINFDTRIFGGNSKANLQPGSSSTLDVEGMMGALVSAEGDGWKIQSTFARMDLRSNIASFSNGAPPTLTFTSTPIPDLSIWLVGGKYDRGGLVAYAEYGHSKTKDDSAKANGYYAMIGHHIGRFLPHYTYANADWHVVPFLDGREISHHYGLNFQVNPAIVIKAEYLRQLDKRGLVFLTQTGQWAESMSVGINAVF